MSEYPQQSLRPCRGSCKYTTCVLAFGQSSSKSRSEKSVLVGEKISESYPVHPTTLFEMSNSATSSTTINPVTVVMGHAKAVYERSQRRYRYLIRQHSGDANAKDATNSPSASDQVQNVQDAQDAPSTPPCAGSCCVWDEAESDPFTDTSADEESYDSGNGINRARLRPVKYGVDCRPGYTKRLKPRRPAPPGKRYVPGARKAMFQAMNRALQFQPVYMIYYSDRYFRLPLDVYTVDDTDAAVDADDEADHVAKRPAASSTSSASTSSA